MEWIVGEGVRVNALATCFGELSYVLRSQTNGGLTFELSGTLSLPAGGIILRPPLNGDIGAVTLNGDQHPDFTPREIRISTIPARLTIQTQAAD